MGGASNSEIDNNTGIWKGTVTSANNGGFVGIRTTPASFAPALDMNQCKGIQIKLKGGDGKRFKAIVRDSKDFNGICWTTSFDAPNKSILFQNNSGVIKIPFNKQIPTIFANVIPDATFNSENVVGFQLTYSKVSLLCNSFLLILIS